MTNASGDTIGQSPVNAVEVIIPVNIIAKEKYIVSEMQGRTMKYLLFILALTAVVITAGCVGGNTSPQPLTSPLTTIDQTAALSPPSTALPAESPAYKNADLVLTLNTQPAYGFKMDYPSEWTYKKEHTRDYSAGYNFSSPDERSYVFVGFANGAGSGDYFYPLSTITETSLDKTSWEYNVIKSMTVAPYCHDQEGNPSECTSVQPASDYYRWRLISNDTVILSGNIKARKIVFAPDMRDTSAHWVYTVYIMHVGTMQGYNFTVPDHFEIARPVPGDVWDYGTGGQAYSITMVAPTKNDSDSPLYDHMITSFEVTINNS